MCGARFEFPMDNRDEILAAVRGRLAKTSGEVAAAYVFGSVGRDEMRADSDVDVGVLFSTVPASRLDALPAQLEVDLERKLGRTVQVVTLNRAPVDLVHRVLRDGEIVFEADPAARIRFEVNSRNAFFDLQPFLRRYRGLDTASR